MKCKREFEYKKAIIADVDMIMNLSEEINKICNKIDYSAELINGDELEFNSIDELLAFENSKDNQFKKIEIFAIDSEKRTNEIRVYMKDSAGNSFFSDCGVRFVIHTDNIDTITIFKEKAIHICERHSQSNAYNFLSKTNLFRFLGYFSLGVVLSCVIIMFQSKFKVNTIFLYIGCLFSVYLMAKDFIEKTRKKYFHMIVFYLGDGIKIYDDQKSKRNSFFWSVIIGGGLTIIVGIIGIWFSIK